jgi:prepilin-type processing-associated H-X9-DG protein
MDSNPPDRTASRATCGTRGSSGFTLTEDRLPGWNANGQGNLGGSLGTPGGSGRVFQMNQDLVLAGKRVFGPQDDKQAANQPDTIKYPVVCDGTAKTPVGKIVMLMDFEALMHGTKRNFLFLDFHVEGLPNTRTMDARPQ